MHNTWRFGLDRILTGVAMSDDSRPGWAPRCRSTTSEATG
ncbi:exodeoxyribonuclease V, gamma subunit [Mycobacterium xenopi 4042]|uniref:Exodeoxyribonuclease V, gamma subunit n=1 Tax=Mycobacterium xenopi 4042 TaxID=1299334 RepID=X8BIB4_MYCXE|nr:exodeoxyribonuclease V, gamma subunit [Mycobacterium xenopi 4042]